MCTCVRESERGRSEKEEESDRNTLDVLLYLAMLDHKKLMHVHLVCSI